MLRYGLAGAGMSLLLVDLSMIAYVLRHSLAHLNKNFSGFAQALLRALSLGLHHSDVTD